MQPVDSSALASVSRVLQLSSSGSFETTFDDENLQQSLDVAPLVRRALTILNGKGWWGAAIATVHAGAGDITTSYNPYSVGTGSAQNGYPVRIEPETFDVWLLGGIRLNLSATATFTGAVLDIVMQQGRGFGATGNGAFPVAVWTGSVTPLTGGIFGTIQGSGSATGPMNAIRVPPDGLLRLRSLASGPLTATAEIAIGVFPAGLGQDAIGTN